MIGERKEITSSGRIAPRSGVNDRVPYEHQKKAMECMDQINTNAAFSTLVVLPTGGGKTYTAALWLLHNAVDRHKKTCGWPTGRCCWTRRRRPFRSTHTPR